MVQLFSQIKTLFEQYQADSFFSPQEQCFLYVLEYTARRMRRVKLHWHSSSRSRRVCKFLVDGCDARVQRSREDWVSIDPKGFLSTCLLSPGSGVHTYIHQMEWSIVCELVMDLGYPKNLDVDYSQAEGLHFLPNSGGHISCTVV